MDPGEEAVTSMEAALTNAAKAAGPPLLFGVRLWASVCLALYVAFRLELDNEYWAGLTAAIVCQPQLGASLRKGWFRMIGTLGDAVAIVALTAWFPQERAPFLIALALWGGTPNVLLGAGSKREAQRNFNRRIGLLDETDDSELSW
jgi:uncharacterized membrane protein YccC